MATYLKRLTWGLMTFVLGTAIAVAHTSASSTIPKSGAVLDQSPPAIEITFKAAARLTSVMVHQQGKPERKLSFVPNAEATTFKIDKPQLAQGQSEVRWVALSKDGHVVKGVITLTVKAPAAKTS